MAFPFTGLAALLGPLGEIINKVVKDPNEAARIKAEVTSQMLNAEGEFYKAAGSIITAEAKGESWMQRNWRPLTMLTFVFIIANNYILTPYAEFIGSWFGLGLHVPTLPIPDGMWTLLQIGIGGYIASRGGEKMIKSIQDGEVPLIGSHKETTRIIEDIREDQREMTTAQSELLEQLRDIR